MAVVYVLPGDLKAAAATIGVEGTFEELTQNEDVKKHFVELLAATKKELGLKGFERVVRIHISDKTFEELELLTTTFKLKRFIAK